MTIKVHIVPGKPSAGKLRYLSESDSFDFEPAEPQLEGFAVLTVQYLELLVNPSEGQIKYIVGRSPSSSWSSGHLTPPFPVAVECHLDSKNLDLRAGVGSIVDGSWAWGAAYDATTGWLRTGGASDDAAIFAEIATDTLLEISGEELLAVWLRVHVQV